MTSRARRPGRPSTQPTGQAWELLHEWALDHPMGPLNQTEMADLFGVSVKVLTDWKYARCAIQADRLLEVAWVTSIDVAELAAAVRSDVPGAQAAHEAKGQRLARAAITTATCAGTRS